MFCFLASLSGVLAGVSCLFSFSVSISSIAFSSSAIICPADFGAHCRVAADMRAATLTNHKEKQVPWGYGLYTVVICWLYVSRISLLLALNRFSGWTGRRENLQETMLFPMKMVVSCKFSLKPNPITMIYIDLQDESKLDN